MSSCRRCGSITCLPYYSPIHSDIVEDKNYTLSSDFYSDRFSNLVSSLNVSIKNISMSLFYFLLAGQCERLAISPWTQKFVQTSLMKREAWSMDVVEPPCCSLEKGIPATMIRLSKACYQPLATLLSRQFINVQTSFVTNGKSKEK